MRFNIDKAMTYSTMEDQRRQFTGNPWRYAVAPKGNVISAGNYQVVDGRLQKIDSSQTGESKPCEIVKD